MSATEGNHSDSHPEEPKTPMWLPAIGAVLFLVVGLLWAMSSPSKDAQAGASAPGASARDAGAPRAR